MMNDDNPAVDWTIETAEITGKCSVGIPKNDLPSPRFPFI